MVTTSPDNLWSPNASDPYNLTTDLAAMQSSVQAALTARRQTYRTDLTDAQRAALPAGDRFEGLRVWTTDTKVLWTYTGGAWVRHLPGQPFAMASGRVSSTPSGNYTTVNFPSGRFTVAPTVTASGGNQSSVGVPRIIDVTASSFKVGVWSAGGAAISGSNIDWQAVQMTPTTATG